jgi:hypothetical protein
MKPISSTIICILAGIAIATVGYWLLGYTAAIAAPTQWFEWFNSTLGSYAGLVAWEMLVVQFLGVGLVATLVAFLVVKYTSLPWWQACLFIISAELGTVILLQFPYITSLGGLLLLQHAHEIVVIVCVLIAGYVSARNRPVFQPV